MSEAVEARCREAWAVHAGAPVDALDLVAAPTLVHAWRAQWREAPDAPLLSEDGDTWLTRGAFEARTADAARRLAALGARAGDRVLLSAAPSIAFAVAHVAALRLGCTVVPMNTAYRAREIAHIVADARPSVVVVDDVERAAWARVAGAATVVDDPTFAGVDPADRSAVTLDAAAPQDLALLVYTSGTTGAPKGAQLSHRNLVAGTEAVRRAWRWTERDRLVLVLPLFHMHGLGVGLHGTLLAGGSAIVRPGFDIDEVLGFAARADTTLFFGVPTMYERFVSHPDAKALARLRLCVSGSAPLSAETHRRFEALTGSAVLERYGMSETLMNLSNPYDGERRPGSVGLPLPGVQARLAEDGEIQLRGPNVFSGYWDRPDAQATAFTDDGWFRTGDLGAMADDGYFTILGRSKELIITGGYNVYPREVEDVLAEHPGVAEVAVAGTPSDEWGEIVTAYVVVRAGAECTQRELAALCDDGLAGFKRPRVYHFVEALPRNALGKVLRHQLAPSAGD